MPTSSASPRLTHWSSGKYRHRKNKFLHRRPSTFSSQKRNFMNLSDPRFFTEDDMRAFNAPLQEVAKAAAALNPPKPWLRTVSEIKLDIARWTAEAKDNREGFEGLLPKFKRQLTEHLKAREELKAALTRTEGQIDGLR